MATNDSGFSDHTILVEIRDDLKAHIRQHDQKHAEIGKEIDLVERELYNRPTRKELLAMLGGAGVLSGFLFGLITFL